MTTNLVIHGEVATAWMIFFLVWVLWLFASRERSNARERAPPRDPGCVGRPRLHPPFTDTFAWGSLATATGARAAVVENPGCRFDIYGHCLHHLGAYRTRRELEF